MKNKKWKIFILILVGIILAKIIVKLVALPKITIDYVAKYNELTKPIGFTPEDNAADYYKKACELYKETPEELDIPSIIFNKYEAAAQFFADIDPNYLHLLENWLASNKPAIEQIKLAIQKPYCWFERESEKGSTLGIMMPELFPIREIIQALFYSARLNALKNNYRTAIDDLIVCYRVGQHQCRENLSTVEQYAGITIKNKTIKTALDILPCLKTTPEELKYFQDSLCALIDDDSYVPGTSTEKIFQYDLVQRIFLDYIRGSNRPAFRLMRQMRCMCDDNNFLWVNAFVGPSRHKVLSQIDRLFELYDQLRGKTPWQVHFQCVKQLSEIEAICKSNFFMKWFAPSLKQLFSFSQESKAQTDALVTVLAILRFKADNNRLPDTLDELVSNGYMKKLPQDPYSEGVLIYRVIDNEFKLYSVGKNFENNNGEPIISEKEQMFGFGRGIGFEEMDMSNMPPSPLLLPPKIMKKTIYKDTMYWPVLKTPVKIELVEP